MTTTKERFTLHKKCRKLLHKSKCFSPAVNETLSVHCFRVKKSIDIANRFNVGEARLELNHVNSLTTLSRNIIPERRGLLENIEQDFLYLKQPDNFLNKKRRTNDENIYNGSLNLLIFR